MVRETEPEPEKLDMSKCPPELVEFMKILPPELHERGFELANEFIQSPRHQLMGLVAVFTVAMSLHQSYAFKLGEIAGHAVQIVIDYDAEMKAKKEGEPDGNGRGPQS